MAPHPTCSVSADPCWGVIISGISRLCPVGRNTFHDDGNRLEADARSEQATAVAARPSVMRLRAASAARHQQACREGHWSVPPTATSADHLTCASTPPTPWRPTSSLPYGSPSSGICSPVPRGHRFGKPKVGRQDRLNCIRGARSHSRQAKRKTFRLNGTLPGHREVYPEPTDAAPHPMSSGAPSPHVYRLGAKQASTSMSECFGGLSPERPGPADQPVREGKAGDHESVGRLAARRRRHERALERSRPQSGAVPLSKRNERSGVRRRGYRHPR